MAAKAAAEELEETLGIETGKRPAARLAVALAERMAPQVLKARVARAEKRDRSALLLVWPDSGSARAFQRRNFYEFRLSKINTPCLAPGSARKRDNRLGLIFKKSPGYVL
jgi:hypothetical protein